jgi:hypothetical protein
LSFWLLVAVQRGVICSGGLCLWLLELFLERIRPLRLVFVLKFLSDDISRDHELTQCLVIVEIIGKLILCIFEVLELLSCEVVESYLGESKTFLEKLNCV